MQDKPSPTPQRPKIHWFWWLVAIGLLIWNIFAFLPKTSPEVTIPYSAFLDQVESGNVVTVQLSGSEITGKFAKEVLWPQPGSQAAAAAPSATPVPPASYIDFNTIYPEAEGDPNLITMLRQNNVEINVAPPPNPLVSMLLTYALPFLLFIVLMFWLMRRQGWGQRDYQHRAQQAARVQRGPPQGDL